MMQHVVLLGDSIFDNAVYVPSGQPVVEQLRQRLPRPSRATLLAVDGAIVQDVHRQLQRLPDDATHLVVSAGGNDALESSPLIRDERITAQQGFIALAQAQALFREEYRGMLEAVAQAQLPTILCTVYDAIPGLPDEEKAGLSTFNDVILRQGIERGLPVIDLRFVCDEAADYSHLSPIEPSERGGAKIATAIAAVVGAHDFRCLESVIYRS